MWFTKRHTNGRMGLSVPIADPIQKSCVFGCTRNRMDFSKAIMKFHASTRYILWNWF